MYAPDAIVASVPMTPIRPFRVRSTAARAPGSITPTIGIENRASSDQILFEKVHDAGLYLGGGAGLRFGESWIAQGEVVSYDKDELFLTFGIRKHF